MFLKAATTTTKWTWYPSFLMICNSTAVLVAIEKI